MLSPATVQRQKLSFSRPIRSVTMPPLHQLQSNVVEDPHRFKVLACGRRWGKTRMCAAICVSGAIQGLKVWWVAPSYGVANVGWRELIGLASQVPGVEIKNGDRLIKFPGGGFVQVRSAAGQTGLRGEGLDLLIIDECSFVQEGVWTEALRPALSDRKGKAILISTPKGRNWFWRLWLRGQESDPDWKSWRFPTVSNPFIDPAEVAEAARNLPQRSYEQEYLAEFLEDAGSIFRKVMLAATAQEMAGPLKGHHYTMGVDWAKHEDFTVLTVMDADQRKMVAWDRFNHIDYAVQKGRLTTLARHWGVGTIWAERNSIGEPLIEELEREGLPVFPFTTTNSSKKEIVDALALAFEKEAIRILPEPVLTNELQAYETKKTPSGLLRYTAPDGTHDDCVISLALANMACIAGAPAEIMDNPFV
jgi:hypothetical protein